MSLVGFVPPLPIGESLHVDGGYCNQYPIDELRQQGAGGVICVVACPDHGPVNTEYGDIVKGGLCSLRSTFGCCRRKNNLPEPPTQAEIQERLMFLFESNRESE